MAWGIWMGPELAQVAVSEGLARSRRDLIVKLDAGFETLRRHPTAFDIDADAADDNLKAIAEEARALGVELRKTSAERRDQERGRRRRVGLDRAARRRTGIAARHDSIEELIAHARRQASSASPRRRAVRSRRRARGARR